MDNYLKIPLLASLKIGHFTFCNKTQDISSIEQIAIYAKFEHKGKIHEHFISILSLSQTVGTTLTAENIMKVLVEYIEQMEVPIPNSCFLCMDTANVNLGEKKA